MQSQYDVIQARIAELDLEPIMFKVVKEHGFSEQKVRTIEKWYRRFLFLTFKYTDRPIVVSEAIDTFWHQHILDTRKYADDCQTVFGGFLHHFPYFGLRGEEDQRALRVAHLATLALMQSEYGETPEADLAALGSAPYDIEAASSCSDCSGETGIESQLFRDRPGLTSATAVN